MPELSIWIVESKHENPNSFYVKVDGSSYYTSVWVANTNSLSSANKLTIEACAELDLGNVEIVHTTPLIEIESETRISNELKERIKTLAEQIHDQEDVQMAAWISSNGGLW